MTYVAVVRRCRWGWVGVVTIDTEGGRPDPETGLFEPLMELVEPPTYWRLTKRQAVACTLRKCRAWNAADERRRQAETYRIAP